MSHVNPFEKLQIEPIRRVAYRQNEAAEACGVSARTFAKWMKCPNFPMAKIGGTTLIPIPELQNWLTKQVAKGREVQR